MLALVLSVVAELAAPEPARVAAAVAAIEAEPARDADADELLAAGRACEERLAQPARALQLYARVLAERPDARAAIAAGRRARALRAELGDAGEHAAEADALARLIAEADRADPADVARRADALAARAWPGADRAALWLATWQQRAGDCADARPRFERLATARPALRAEALRGAATCALDAHAWSDAEQLAAQLPVAADVAAAPPAAAMAAAPPAAAMAAAPTPPVADPVSAPAAALLRADLLRLVARGRWLDRLALAAWLVAAGALAALLAALARAPGSRARFAPPTEAIYAAPIALALIAIAAASVPLAAPAVALIGLGGLALTYASGAALAAHRAAGRATRARGAAHAAACALAALALAYLALTRAGLLDQTLETLRHGPD